MKTLLLALLLLAPQAHALSVPELTPYQRVEHWAMHFGGGTLVGTTVQVFNQVSGLDDKYPWVAFGLTLGVTAFVASAKESDDVEHGGQWNWEQWGSTMAGGLIATQVHFDWPNKRRK